MTGEDNPWNKRDDVILMIIPVPLNEVPQSVKLEYEKIEVLFRQHFQ